MSRDSRARTLWPPERGPVSFAAALTSDTPAGLHTCLPWLLLLEETAGLPPHRVAECPGPIGLSVVVTRSWTV